MKIDVFSRILPEKYLDTHISSKEQMSIPKEEKEKIITQNGGKLWSLVI